LIEISKNKKYTVPDLSDDRTMKESIKRVRELLMERTSKVNQKNSPLKRKNASIDDPINTEF
jgi:hypothetical protein